MLPAAPTSLSGSPVIIFDSYFLKGPGLRRSCSGLRRSQAARSTYWAFAPWKSRNWHPDMAAVYEDIEKYRALGLPASVLVLDSPWATNYNTFEVNQKQFT